MAKKRIAIIGYGSVGQFLCDKIRQDDKYELAFAWNRTASKLEGLPPEYRLAGEDLSTVFVRKMIEIPPIDLIVEVAHPNIIQQYACLFLKYADLLVSSPTAFANSKTEQDIRECVNNSANGLYIASGAAWGVQDIAKMADLNTLTALSITMSKHPDAFKLKEPLFSKCQDYIYSSNEEVFEIYTGNVATLCPLAPNNVNTMACLAMAAPQLGFQKTQGRIVADKSLSAHIVEIEATGKDGFTVKTVRYNPAASGAVTGNSTYDSFWASLQKTGHQGSGIHFC